MWVLIEVGVGQIVAAIAVIQRRTIAVVAYDVSD